MTASSSPPTWSRDTKFIVTMIALLVALALVYLARGVIPLLVLAAVLAYIFQPLVGWLERRRVKRGLASATAVILLVLLVVLAPLLLIPATVSGVRAILEVLSDLPQVFEQTITAFVTRNPQVSAFGYTIDMATAVNQAEVMLNEAIAEIELPGITDLISYTLQGVRTASGILSTAAGIASGVATVAFSSLLLLIYTFFLTKDGVELGGWLDNLLLPQYQPEARELGHRLNLVWKSFFRGQLLLSLTVGVVTFIATSLLGLPGSIVLGILAGVLEVVPNLGPVLAMIPAVLVALIRGSTYLPIENNLVFALIVVLVYVLIQQVENNVLVPRIMGQSLNLHPLLVLVGVVVGAGFAGILGAFLAGPVLASLKILGWYAHAKVNDMDPFTHPMLPNPEDKPPGRLSTSFARLFGGQRPAPPAAVSDREPMIDAATGPVVLSTGQTPAAPSADSEAA